MSVSIPNTLHNLFYWPPIPICLFTFTSKIVCFDDLMAECFINPWRNDSKSLLQRPSKGLIKSSWLDIYWQFIFGELPVCNLELPICNLNVFASVKASNKEWNNQSIVNHLQFLSLPVRAPYSSYLWNKLASLEASLVWNSAHWLSDRVLSYLRS